MATKKRKTTTRRSTSRKKRAEQRLPAGLGTLFAGLLLVGLAFVEGDSVWKTLHQVLFGNPLTMEALVYGLVSSLMLLTMWLWCAVWQVWMTNERFLYLFGNLAPTLDRKSVV